MIVGVRRSCTGKKIPMLDVKDDMEMSGEVGDGVQLLVG